MLEGIDNTTWWDWKDTLYPLRYRKGFPGYWGYQQTHGLGMMEYLWWAEDMDLELGKSPMKGTVTKPITYMNSSRWRLCWSIHGRQHHSSR